MRAMNEVFLMQGIMCLEVGESVPMCVIKKEGLSEKESVCVCVCVSVFVCLCVCVFVCLCVNKQGGR